MCIHLASASEQGSESSYSARERTMTTTRAARRLCIFNARLLRPLAEGTRGRLLSYVILRPTSEVCGSGDARASELEEIAALWAFNCAHSQSGAGNKKLSLL